MSSNDAINQDPRIDEMLAIVRNMDTGIRNLGTRLEEVEKNVQTMGTGIRNLGTRLETVENKIETIESDIKDALQKQIQTVQSQLTEMRAEMNKGFRAIDRQIGTLSHEIVRLRADYRDVEDRVGKLENNPS